MQLVRQRGSPKQFWMLSIFQFMESGVLFAVWLYYTWTHTHEMNQILLPTLSLICLALRPFCDTVCQMKLLTPLAQNEVQICVRFKGTSTNSISAFFEHHGDETSKTLPFDP